MVGVEVANLDTGGGEGERRRHKVVSEKLGDWNEMRNDGDKSLGKTNVQGVCVEGCACARVCTHTHMCQNMRGMECGSSQGPVRPEAAFPASRQNVFFTQGLMAGTSLLKSSGR